MIDLVIPTDQSVKLSDAAIEHFSANAKDKVIKLSLVGGKCAGFQYTWEMFDNEDSLFDNDTKIAYNDFTFVVDGASEMMLLGSIVDVEKDMFSTTLVIQNPNASNSCGCGQSVNF